MRGDVTWPGYERLQKRLAGFGKIAYADAEPVLIAFADIIVEDNRKGVMEGTDRDGNPMARVTYRTGATKPSKQRQGSNFGVPKFAAKGITFGNPKGDPHANNNLTTAEYKKLTGPPLAPRGERSRVIANLQTTVGQNGPEFYAMGTWHEVVDCKGRQFLDAHFEGKSVGRGGRTKLPRRDLRGVRPWGMAKARAATIKWAKWLLNGKVG